MTVAGDLHQRLWENAPPCRAELPDGSPVWLVTRYADVRALLADPRLSVDKANGDGSWRGFSLPPALDANLLDRIAADGEADLVRDYAGPLPVTVISDLLGVPETDRDDVRVRTDAMLLPPSVSPAGYRSSSSQTATESGHDRISC